MDKLEVLQVFQLKTRDGTPMPMRFLAKRQEEADAEIGKWAAENNGNSGGVWFDPNGDLRIRVLC